MTDRRALSHLLRRLTFGPTQAEVDAAVRAGYDATLTALLRPSPLPVPPDLGADPVTRLAPDADREQRRKARREQNEQVDVLTRWWLARLTEAGAAEKLTFFWHGHWATSARKVRSAQLMLAQQQTLRRYGTGDTGALVRAMLRDPALIVWLDGQKNSRRAPNENLARELMELFTLGLGAYTEADVKAGARVLTGWRIERATGVARLVAARHDGRPVTLLGRTGSWDVDSYADLLVRHEAHLPFLARRLWVRYAAASGPSPAATTRIIAAGRETTALLGAVCRDPEFAGTRGQLVKQPVEWLVGALRQLGVGFTGLDRRQQGELVATLRRLGQLPLRPPSVGGWPVGESWLTTSTTLTRLKAAQGLAALAPATTDRLTGGDRIEVLAALLAVDDWTAGTRQALQSTKDPRRLIALALASPEYAVH